MTKYIVKDRFGKEIKYNQRIADFRGNWWYFKGITKKMNIVATTYAEQDSSEGKIFRPRELNVDILEVHDPNYNVITHQGYKVIQKWGYDSYIHVIVKRDHDYVVGLYYDLETGTWGQGKYDFKTVTEAQTCLLRYMYDSYVK